MFLRQRVLTSTTSTIHIDNINSLSYCFRSTSNNNNYVLFRRTKRTAIGDTTAAVADTFNKYCTTISLKQQYNNINNYNNSNNNINVCRYYHTIRTGTVVKFDIEKGWGFIRPHDSSIDVFVHYKSIYADGFRILNVGEHVEYTMCSLNEIKGSRPKAIHVTGPNGNFVAGKQFVPIVVQDEEENEETTITTTVPINQTYKTPDITIETTTIPEIITNQNSK